MATDTEALTIKIRADIKSLQAGLRQAGKEAEIAGNAMQKNLAGPMGKVQTAMAAGATAAKAAFLGITTAALAAGTALAAITRRALETADGLVKMSDKTGVGIEALQRFRYAASQAGIGTDELDQGLTFFTKTLSEAAIGAGNAAAVFRQLGVSLSDGNGPRSAEAVFRDVVAALESIPNQSQRAAAALDVFGKSGLNVGIIANQGAGYLAKMEEEATRLGLVLGEDLVRSGDAAGDALDRLKLVITSGLTKAVLQAAPEIEKFVSDLTADPEKIQAFTNDLVEIAKGIATVGGAARAAWEWVELLGGALGQGLAKTKLDIAGIARPDAMDFTGGYERPPGYGDPLDRPDSGPGQPGPSINYTDPAKAAAAAKSAGERRSRELAADAKHREALIEQAATFAATELAVEEMKYQMRRAALLSANESELKEYGTKNELLLNLDRKHQEAVAEINAAAEAGEAGKVEARRAALDTITAMTADNLALELLANEQGYDDALMQLDKFLADKLITKEEYYAAELAGVLELEKRKAEIEQAYRDAKERSEKQERQYYLDKMVSDLQVVGAQSRKMFKVAQAAAIANTAVKTADAAMGAWASLSSIPYVGPALGAAAAAAAVGAGMAQISAIKSQQFGGSASIAHIGGGGGGSSGGAQAGMAQGRGGAPAINLTLSGSMFSAEQVRELVTQINEALSDGARLNVGGGG